MEVADIKPSNQHCSHGTSLNRNCDACEKLDNIYRRLSQEHAEMRAVIAELAQLNIGQRGWGSTVENLKSKARAFLSKLQEP